MFFNFSSFENGNDHSFSPQQLTKWPTLQKEVNEDVEDLVEAAGEGRCIRN